MRARSGKRWSRSWKTGRDAVRTDRRLRALPRRPGGCHPTLNPAARRGRGRTPPVPTGDQPAPAGGAGAPLGGPPSAGAAGAGNRWPPRGGAPASRAAGEEARQRGFPRRPLGEAGESAGGTGRAGVLGTALTGVGITIKPIGQIAQLLVLTSLPGCAVGAPPSARLTGRTAASASYRGAIAGPGRVTPRWPSRRGRRSYSEASTRRSGRQAASTHSSPRVRLSRLKAAPTEYLC